MSYSICPNCKRGEMSVFYEVDEVPVHSVLLMRTREQALDYPTGKISLAFCEQCGFISNVAFDPTAHDYAGEYEATQSYSPTFNSFNRKLARRLIDAHDLHDKTIIEIGCGHGEFLILLCDMGPNHGVGFDPAYVADRLRHPAKARIEFIKDFYSEAYADVQGDFVVCKMTLEHIPETAEFVATLRRSIGDRLGTRVFFQIPNASYLLRDVAFWDVYYEHCSYFTEASLAALFRQNGFEITNLYTDYDDQYLMIESTAKAGHGQYAGSRDLAVEAVKEDVRCFGARVQERIGQWRRNLDAAKCNGRKVVLWGSGSKAVAFLTTLGISSEVGYVVDINPNKHGTFMAGTGQEIIGPRQLKKYRPNVVIIMNPIYKREIAAQLADMKLEPQLLTVESPTKMAM